MSKDNSTLGITLRFFTNNVKVVHDNGDESLCCWQHGSMAIEANKTKGIRSASINFNCREDILPAIDELLRNSHVVVVSGNGRPRVLSHRRAQKIRKLERAMKQ